MGWSTWLFVALASYGLGSVPFGALLARRRGVDIQRAGSGNIGATNVARTLGKKLGALVLLLDAGKGALAVAGAGWLVAATGAPPRLVTLAGICAVLGHCFPWWLRFVGGKGVATALGVLLVVDPRLTLAAAAVFALVFALVRIASVGSLAGVAGLLAGSWWLGRPREMQVLAGAIAAVIFLQHRGNLRRLWRGKERRV